MGGGEANSAGEVCGLWVAASRTKVGAHDLTPANCHYPLIFPEGCLKESEVDTCIKEDYKEEKKIRSKVFKIKVRFCLP